MRDIFVTLHVRDALISEGSRFKPGLHARRKHRHMDLHVR